MKRENVFETDSPTLEMETQTLRTTQQGQQIPFVNGIPVSPYAGTNINPSTAPYQQQAGFAGSGINPQQITPNQFTPQFINQAAYQPQPYLYPNNLYQPVAVANPGFFPNQLHVPYITNPYNGFTPNFATPLTPTPWAGQPYVHPMQAQFAGSPLAQQNFATTPYQPSNLQPAFNITDGMVTLLPQQNTPVATRNGSAYQKNSERDFISWNPTVNILETDRTFKIEICVPGVARENCRINIDKNNILRITGTRRWNQETDAVGFTRKEFNYGSFACSFILNENLQRERITSSCRNGILIVSIPKREQNSAEGEDRNFSEISVN